MKLEWIMTMAYCVWMLSVNRMAGERAKAICTGLRALEGTYPNLGVNHLIIMQKSSLVVVISYKGKVGPKSDDTPLSMLILLPIDCLVHKGLPRRSATYYNIT